MLSLLLKTERCYCMVISLWYRACVCLTDDSQVLTLRNISRHCSDVYECIADNGVPPSVSRRMRVSVECQSLTATYTVCILRAASLYHSSNQKTQGPIRWISFVPEMYGGCMGRGSWGWVYGNQTSRSVKLVTLRMSSWWRHVAGARRQRDRWRNDWWIMMRWVLSRHLNVVSAKLDGNVHVR